MGKWRDEVKILACGCKIGRSKQGLWFYDFLCETHVKKVYDGKGHYSLKLAEEMTKAINEAMKKNPPPEFFAPMPDADLGDDTTETT